LIVWFPIAFLLAFCGLAMIHGAEEVRDGPEEAAKNPAIWVLCILASFFFTMAYLLAKFSLGL